MTAYSSEGDTSVVLPATARAARVGGFSSSATDNRVEVTALSDAGDSADPSGIAPPQASLEQTSKTSTSVGLAWSVESGGVPPTGFLIQTRNEDGTWTTRASVPGTATGATVTGLDAATSYWVRVLTDSDMGLGSASETYISTSGTRSLPVAISTGAGDPVIGGAVSWRTNDGTMESSKAFGLTSNGAVELARVPAEYGYVTLRNGLLPSGSRVSGRWEVMFHAQRAERLTVPDEPEHSSPQVRVLLPNGIPVPGASVKVTGLRSSVDLGDFTVTEDGATSGVTNSDGLFTAHGFADAPPMATVTYDDGVLIQRVKDVALVSQVTEVTLEEMPWLETADTMKANFNQQVSIPVTLAGSSARRAARQQATSPVRVRIVPPAGASQKKCKAKLNGTIGSSGRTVLKVCATRSGEYRLKGAGAVANGSVFLKVAKAPPLSVTAATARSTALGKATIAWNPPVYTGGAKVLRYQVVLSGHGATKKVSTTKRSVAFSSLANATTYKARITAVTKYGASRPVRLSVPVA